VTPLPEHRPRRSDIDPRAAKRAERQVGLLFLLSAAATIGFIVAFFAIPRDATLRLPPFGETLAANFVLGLAMGISLFAIGAAAIHWAKKLMPDVEVVQERHLEGRDDEGRAELLAEYQRGVEESGFKRRPFIAGSMIAALGLVGLPAIVLLKDLGPPPGNRLGETMWRAGMRILVAETQRPLRPEDLTVGTLVSAVPEGLDLVLEESGTLNELAKAPVILIRMDPSEIVAQQGPGWDYQGILCFSKICTHVGCPLGLYEQQTHHVLCPCHQSTFDLSDAARVVFGPAARSLPQLAITVDQDGYLVSRDGFTEPVGPSFWERG
jgi:ubiquinol-cytochrome c reductase iron-sulfur subunit